MGDLIGSAVSGTLYWVPRAELERVRRAEGPRFERAALFADACRLNALYMIARAGSGHIGSSFSSLDLVSWLYLEELRDDAAANDVYFSSKGHDAPGLYAVMLGVGLLPFEKLHELRRLGGLPGHPDVGTPGIAFNTGSLGMGVSKAKGYALGRRRQGRAGRVYVMLGDGELQEGQIWESLVSAVNYGLDELTVIVDHNKLQSDRLVAQTSPLGDLVAKFRAFGLETTRIDGHDFGAISAAFEHARGVSGRPQLILADTIKGRGVSFMEHTALESDLSLYRFHSGAPDAASYTRAVEELIERLAAGARSLRIEPLALESTDRPALPLPAAEPERLIPAYTRALVQALERTPALVALDADLMVDTGQADARERFSERWFECGIAEMDMVSVAGGMARSGLLPVCHSFACFLSTRANEQIYNNATERTKVVYVMSLAGLLPAGPGHSHQSVRDISALAAVPGLTLISPGSAAEVQAALEWCVAGTDESSVLRLESVPCEVPYRVPAGYRLSQGIGVELRPGSDAVFIGYGPVLLSEAFRAAEALERDGLSVAVVNLPWLNRVDPDWLARTVIDRRHVFALDNHLATGGQGQMLAATLATLGLEAPPRMHLCGVAGIPVCGTNREVLRAHRLDAESLAERVKAALGAR
jgi:transketolase